MRALRELLGTHIALNLENFSPKRHTELNILAVIAIHHLTPAWLSIIAFEMRSSQLIQAR